MEVNFSRRGFVFSAMTAGLLPVQNFFVYVMDFAVSMYKDAALDDRYRHILMSQCSEEWPGLLYRKDVETLLALDCSAQCLTLKKTKILHADSGR